MAERADDRGQLQAVLLSLVNALSIEGTRVKLDFSKTTRLFPGGMLLLLAYLELLLETKPGRIRAVCAPGSIPAQLMRHFGIADRLGISPARSVPRHESVVHWRYLTGTMADGQTIAELLQSYRVHTEEDIPAGLYDVLTEALTNVRHHAYPESGTIPSSLHRWWLFANYVEPTNNAPGNLFIGVYDIGIGIQTSMRQRLRPGELVLEKAGKLLDLAGIRPGHRLEQLLLEAAVERDRTSTGLEFRGHGLPEMRDFVMKSDNGRLSIISGHAQYSCSAAQTGGSQACDDPILGTLILWNIQLRRKEVRS